jgi:hypothetical protein
MDGNTNQARACEGVQPTSGGVHIEIKGGDNGTTYWGILCRTCQELTAFDICPSVSFGAGATSIKPGAIRCGHGHNHIYFPRDFQFFPSAVPITDAVMQKNRETFRAINPSSPASSNRSTWRTVEPEAVSEPVISPGGLEKGKARIASLGPDPRREIAQIAAKKRWMNWAMRKAM